MIFPESSEAICHRMLKDIAQQWPHAEGSPDIATQFDPLVYLLTSACSKEFEKIDFAIHASQQRILNRLVDFLTPGVLAGAFPAHAIAQARPHPAAYETRAVDAYFAQHKSKTISFSPLPGVKLVNGAVLYRAVGDQLIKSCADAPEEVIQAPAGKRLSPHSLWLGLELDPSVESLDRLSFFFQWPSHVPDRNNLYHWLKLTTWLLGTREIAAYPALLLGNEKIKHAHSPLKFETAYNTSLHIEQTIYQYYSNQFITLCPDAMPHWQDLMVKYPAGFEAVFPLDALETMQGKCIWLEIQFPAFFPLEALQQASCAINCFPVMNRKLHHKSVSLRESINVVTLESEDSFLDVQQVVDSQEVVYHEIPLNNLREFEGGIYSLRKEGVQKLDQRGASALLRQIINLLREESNTFAAFNKKDYLSKKIVQLNQQLTELEQSTEKLLSKCKASPYLLIKPRKSNTTIQAFYWSTEGAGCNQIPPGSSLGMDTTALMQRKSIRLVTTARGGKDAIDTEEKIHAYKQMLMSRGRVVTMEDIRAYCQVYLGNQVEHIAITKGVDYGPMPTQGLSQIISVYLTPSRAGSTAGTEEWKERCRELELQLNGHSSGIIPIRVSVKSNSF